MDCTICKKKIEFTFLRKILGSYFKDSNGKKRAVCQNCQRTLSSEEIKEKLN